MAKQWTVKKMVHGERFRSLDEFMATLDARERAGLATPDGTTQRPNMETHGYDDFSQCREWALRGWAEGVAMTRRMERELGDVMHFEGQSKMSLGYVGGAPIIPALLAGSPQHMVNPKARVELPVVRVVVNAGFLANVDLSQKIAQGVAVMALVRRLEGSGKRVELVAWKGTNLRRSGQWAQFAVVVKGADENADMGKIAYALAHPSFQRGHNFRWLESWCDNIPHGYGATIELQHCEATSDVEPDFYIPQVQASDTEDATVAYNRLLKRATDAGLIKQH